MKGGHTGNEQDQQKHTENKHSVEKEKAPGLKESFLNL